MINCKICGKECKEGSSIRTHERFCQKRQEKNVSEIQPRPSIDTHISATLPSTPEKPKRTLFWGYSVVTMLIIVSAILQYFFFDLFRINKWPLLIIFILDFLIYVFIMWTIYRNRQKDQMITFETLEEFIKTVPKWCMSEKAPNAGIIGSILNHGKEYKQLVLVSENFEPKTLWVEWNGFIFSVANRGYKPARDVRGDFFFYHIDKKTPLIDLAEATPEDAEDSFQLDAVWNQGVAVGHAAAMSKTQGQIQLILILVICSFAALVLFALYSYSQYGQIHTEISNVNAIVSNTSQMIRNTNAGGGIIVR